MITEALLSEGEFLSLSRQQPEYFATPISFELANNTHTRILGPGIIEFTPLNFGTKDIVLSSGVHGNETAPIEICDDFVKAILTGNMTLAHRVLFLFGNLPSMDIAQRFVEENMNRLFSGAHSSGPGLVNAERKRAQQLEQSVEGFFSAVDGERQRFHYDLHTAIRASKNDKFAVYPFLHGRPRSQQQIAFLSACGVNTILLSESATTTFSYFSSNRFGAHAFTVELGKVRPFGQNDMSQFKQVRQTLKKLICEEQLSLDEHDISAVQIYRVNQTINKTQDDFALHFADDIPNFTDFPQGFKLASETGHIYYCEQDGEAIVFPNAKVENGQRALLTVVPTTL